MSLQSLEVNKFVIQPKEQHDMSETDTSLTLQVELQALSKLHMYLTLLKKPRPFKQNICACV